MVGAWATLLCNDSFPNRCTMVISNDKDVYSYGKQEKGVLGLEESLVLSPTKIPLLKNIKAVECGYQTVCLDFDGNVFTFGGNFYGQLGVGKDKNVLLCTHIPQKVDLPPIKQISCGNDFVMCLSECGELFSFGENLQGQLGLGNNNYYNSPQKVPYFGDIEFIVCGGNYSVCKTIDDVYVWGDNGLGQLGFSNIIKCNAPIKCIEWPSDIIDIKCGSCHTLVLTSTGSVYSCGYNKGQLGRNTNAITYSTSLEQIKELSVIVRIECGICHSLCIDIYHNLYVFGCNQFGQLGLGDTESRCKPVKHPTLSNIIDISRGGCRTLVKTSDNEIYGFGYNDYSQLGIKTDSPNQLTPIRIFQDKEDIWCSSIYKSKAKSARSVSDRPIEEDNTPVKKKQKK